MRAANRQRLRLSGGTELSFITAGEPSKPAVLLVDQRFPSLMRKCSRPAHFMNDNRYAELTR